MPDTPAGQEPSLQTTFAMDDDDTESVCSLVGGGLAQDSQLLGQTQRAYVGAESQRR